MSLGNLYSALHKGLFLREPFYVRMIIPYGMVLVQVSLESVTFFPDAVCLKGKSNKRALFIPRIQLWHQ